MQNYFSDWITKFITNFFGGKTDVLFTLLDIADKNNFEKQFKNVISRDDIERTIYQNVQYQVRDETINKVWAEYFINHYLFKINKYRENFQKCFVYLKECFANLVELFRNYANPNFMIPILKFYMRNLLFTSQLADQELETKKEKTYCIDECGRTLITFFSQFQMTDEKHLVFFAIICLIRIYFKLKTYRNSKTLVGWVEKSGLNFDMLPKAEVTTFYYYTGRLKLYEIELLEAHEILTNAFNLCNPYQFTNKKLILEYLIPLNLFLGITPTDEILQKFELGNYLDFISAYKNGNILLFENSIQKLEERLITLGTFLIVEKLKSYVMRNLVKIIYKCFSEDLAKMNSPVIKIEMIYNILKNVIKLDNMDMDELELYLIGVMYKGLISGYVHNNNKVIVFSKKNPFPKLQDVFKNNYSKII